MDAARFAAALAAVSRAMEGATAPWWIIGRAAVRLHGAATDVADVDLLLAPCDVALLAARTGAGFPSGRSDGRFRSMHFGHWYAAGARIEAMAGLAVRAHDRWTDVALATRRAMPVAGGSVHVPERAELIALLTLFGRDKDLRRARALAT